MFDISEFEKIHSFVTWPDREKEYFPNGDVTLGALGFPEANDSGVANDGTCRCGDGSEQCEMPPTVDVEFSVSHDGSSVSGNNYFKATTHVDVAASGNSVILYLPVKKLDYVANVNQNTGNRESNGTLTLKLFDDVSALGISTYTRSVSTATLVKSSESDDPLTTTKLLTNTYLQTDAEDGTTLIGVVSVDGPDNDFDLPSLNAEDAETAKFLIRVSVDVADSDVYVYLTKQERGTPNGVYKIRNGTFSQVATSITGTQLSPSETEALLSDGKTMDNVGTCCGPHFRKTYSHDEIHNYVDAKIGNVLGFGVYSDIAGCQGGFIDWLTTSGLVDIGTRKGYPVYVNGFGLGSFCVGASRSNNVHVQEHARDSLETYQPWMLWSYGTTSDAKTDSNVSALPLDWPFTASNQSAYNNTNDVSMVTLVKRGITLTDDSSSEPQTYGNLYQDIHEDDDPTKPVIAHRFYSKHHFVLNQKYKRNENGGYEVKPFFINLPASLDMNDGDTYEITVSIQNQKDTSLPEFTNARDLSAYYAAMTQPRVHVLGGRQQFSNKKLPITSVVQVSGGYELHMDRPARDVNGDLLSNGTEVRANVVTTLQGRTLPNFNAFGTITANSSSGSIIACTGELPADRNYHRANAKMYICGLAYIGLVDGEVDNPSTTPMGLVRDDSLFVGDTGSGVSGALDEFNNFYSIDEKDGHRAMPHIDRRYYLASVYQTATNTFPWRMTGRKKLQRLDRVSTDITGSNSIIKMIYDANRAMVTNHQFVDVMKCADGNYNFSAASSPVTYGCNMDWSNVATVLRVALPENLNTENPITRPYGNPVRQAVVAMKNFVNDLYNMRLLVKRGNMDSEVTPKYLSIRDREDWANAGDSIFNSSDIDYSLTSSDEIRKQIARCTLRSLPEYVVKADLYAPSSYLYPSTSDSILFTEEGGVGGRGAGFFAYYNEAPYATYLDHIYASTRATDENECDVVGTPSIGRIFSENSVVKAIASKVTGLPSKYRTLNDLRRYADTALHLEIYDIDISLNSTPADWLNPFTNLSYKDGAPKLNITQMPSLSEMQQQFVAFDAVQMYRFKMDDPNDPVITVSTCMPYISDDTKSKALSEFIEKYVVGYGAEMPIHFYKGRRIQLENGKLPNNTNQIYINNIYRIQKRMETVGCAQSTVQEFVTHYLNDNFAAVASGSASRNPNADYVNIGQGLYSLAATVPPYQTAPEYTQGNTYTRVRMQFTFSQRAGRWYTTEYRQYPCSYLSPLYGNDALCAKEYTVYTNDGQCTVHDFANPTIGVPETRLWHNPACVGFNNYRNVMYAPYSSYPPLDITLGCVPYLFDGENWPYDESGSLKPSMNNSVDPVLDDNSKPIMSKLVNAWKPRAAGGINLYPPGNVDGGHEAATDTGVHANFWSVREYVRPATSILEGTHIPKYEDPDTYNPSAHVNYRQGGLESDPTLYRMFDFPKAGVTQYMLPNPIDPSMNMSNKYLIYHGIEGDRDKEGIFRSDDETFWFGYGIPDGN